MYKRQGNSRPLHTIPVDKSGANKYLFDAATQFSAFLSLHELITTHSIHTFSNSTVDTWTSHDTGKKHTIDYVVTKDAQSANVVAASTLPTIDNGHMLQDHVPSAAAFLFAPLNFQAPTCVRVRVNKAQLRDPSNRATFSRLLAAIPSVPWSLALDAH